MVDKNCAYCVEGELVDKYHTRSEEHTSELQSH